MGSLIVGSSFAKGLSLKYNLPLIPVNHIDGHIYSGCLEDKTLDFPFVSLVVSGGHTSLFLVKSYVDYNIRGMTKDDAAGEAFDKVARMLDLGHAGGAAVAKLAALGNASRFQLPRPMLNRPGLEFSFSGLKTHSLTTWQKSDQTEQDKANIAYAFQEAVVDTLSIKCKRALEAVDAERLVIAGGVGANKRLREKLNELKAEVFFPPMQYCTDNGAMIAYAGAIRLKAGETEEPVILPKPRWSLEELTVV